MGYTVFFSWQSDRSSREGRSLIEKALEEAVKRIAADSNIDEPLRELYVDKDTKNVPGSPRIFETILSKIEDASVFVADLTFCGNRAGGGPIPNPNVLVEYGYALKVLGENCVLSVMNCAHGEASRESMPFDLLNRRFPIRYHLLDGASDDEIRDARKQLCKDLERALRVIFESNEFKNAHGRAAPPPVLFLADIISELEDNLDRAQRPTTGDVYRRPSNTAWLENRNRMTLPPDVRTQLNYIYHEIDSWLDIVNSGLNPNMGSMKLNLIVSGLTQALPPILSQLRALQPVSAEVVKAKSDEGAIKSSDWERMAEKVSRSCQFLRADSQWTSDTRREVWRIAGGNGGMCEALLQQAGVMLLKSPKVRAQLSQEVISEKDNLSRWLLYLKQRGFHEARFPAHEELEDGTKITHVMGGIKDLPGNSAQLCIQCAALET
jgi:hypothetical protein